MGVEKEFLEGQVCKSYKRTGSIRQTAIEMMTTHGCYGWPTSVSRVLERNEVSRRDPWRPSKVEPLIEEYGLDLLAEIDRFHGEENFAKRRGISLSTVDRAKKN